MFWCGRVSYQVRYILCVSVLMLSVAEDTYIVPGSIYVIFPLVLIFELLMLYQVFLCFFCILPVYFRFFYITEYDYRY